MSNHVELSKLVQGGLQEKFDKEFARVVKNIDDPNTVANANRSITLTITFKPDAEREIINTSISTKATLAPDRELATKFIMGQDSAGNVQARELVSGMKNQTYFDDEGTVRSDTGEKVDKETGEIESGAGNVVNFK
ncbi:replication terminator protein [Paenibacillus polymyxa]|uniref:replication terminator protein n=1 Tax=Paenibacillus polymyxa TaxID=1406 RepID=UPI0023F6467C|nr:replication terminator protein [Paenibacillus polymyxa]MDY7990663.1 replication terminator protein [Paenibacillus polymyxa]MDY8117526.1 replication terminator protein [Paenibacillus polymyxa]